MGGCTTLAAEVIHIPTPPVAEYNQMPEEVAHTLQIAKRNNQQDAIRRTHPSESRDQHNRRRRRGDDRGCGRLGVSGRPQPNECNRHNTGTAPTLLSCFQIEELHTVAVYRDSSPRPGFTPLALPRLICKGEDSPRYAKNSIVLGPVLPRVIPGIWSIEVLSKI